jgi:hypothetical protein
MSKQQFSWILTISININLVIHDGKKNLVKIHSSIRFLSFT